MKYKVGERYKLTGPLVCAGDIIEITKVDGMRISYKTVYEGNAKISRLNCFDIGSEYDKNLEPCNKNEAIVIYRKDNQVIALNKKTGEKAVAKCCPEDEFDFKVGAKVAFERLFAIKQVREVKRWAKIGEYIKIVNAEGNSYKKGDIFKTVKKTFGFGCNADGTYDYGKAYYKDEHGKFAYAREYVVLENYEPPKKEKIKIGDLVTVVCDGCLYSTYADYKGFGKWKQNWVRGSNLSNGGVYRLLNIAKHHNGKTDVALIQNESTTQVFVIGLEGLEKDYRKEE